jgi:hypothetical protein
VIVSRGLLSDPVKLSEAGGGDFTDGLSLLVPTGPQIATGAELDGYPMFHSKAAKLEARSVAIVVGLGRSWLA